MTKYWIDAKNWYDSLEKTHDSYGLAHIDLHTGNFHINNNQNLTVFDFDDSAYCFYTYDIIVALISLSSKQTDLFHDEKIKELYLKGYLTENSLNKIWIDRIPAFIRLRNIEMYAWIQFMYGENKKPGHIEYLKSIENSMSQDFQYL